MLAACGTDREPVPATSPSQDTPGLVAGTLEAHAARPTLTLRDTTDSVVGYIVVDKDQAVIALYPPCGQRCPTLRQGESVALPYTAIGGYTPRSTAAMVMWWTYEPRSGGSQTPEGGIQTSNVRLD